MEQAWSPIRRGSKTALNFTVEGRSFYNLELFVKTFYMCSVLLSVVFS